MNVRPEVAEVIRRWLQKAEHDLEAATRILSRKEACPYDTVCFHCQQAIEKYLKALLTLGGIQAPKTHSLVALHALLPTGLRFPISADDLKALTPYATEGRYPEAWIDPQPDEAEQALTTAQAVRNHVRALLPPGLLR